MVERFLGELRPRSWPSFFEAFEAFELFVSRFVVAYFLRYPFTVCGGGTRIGVSFTGAAPIFSVWSKGSRVLYDIGPLSFNRGRAGILHQSSLHFRLGTHREDHRALAYPRPCTVLSL
ncbi:hypothetical protein Rs2_35792 [Raphanus sativus]|nr:hypothetical protein Rs2_35792 [Raphanus sativus]